MATEKQANSLDFGGTLTTTGHATPSAGTDAANKTYVDTGDTAAKARANHTGSQTASTISDFDTQVRTSRLNQMATPNGAVAMGANAITGVSDPTNAQDAATKAYVDTALAGSAQGLAFKGTVRAVSAVNVTIATPGATIDGLTAANGEVFLLTGQSTGSQNGPYVFNGAGSAMTRATNWDASAEATLGSFWVVREGTYVDAFAILSNDTAITLGSTTPTFVFRGTAAGTNGYTEQCPSTSAGATWTVTHGLNSRAVIAQVARVGSPYDIIRVYIERATVNTVLVKPDIAFSAAEYEIMIQKVA